MTLSQNVIQYWPIITTIAALAIAVLMTYFKVQEHSDQLEDLERKFEEISTVWPEIKERLASIEATLKFLVDNRP